jgi:hypothetical protein
MGALLPHSPYPYSHFTLLTEHPFCLISLSILFPTLVYLVFSGKLRDMGYSSQVFLVTVNGRILRHHLFGSGES